jgi:hypothetical protein
MATRWKVHLLVPGPDGRPAAACGKAGDEGRTGLTSYAGLASCKACRLVATRAARKAGAPMPARRVRRVGGGREHRPGRAFLGAGRPS